MMVKIKYNLNEGFKIVDEGEQVLEIVKAEAKPSGRPTMIYITFKAENGAQLINRYDLSIQGALNALGRVCKYTLGTQDADEIDTVTDLPRMVGKKVVCEVVHTKGNQPREDGTFPTFANISKVLGAPEEKTTVSKSARASIPTTDDLD